jgi:hypothetical protein
MKKWFKELMRAICGYKYKVVYSYIKISDTRTRRFMCKLSVETQSTDMLQNLPDYAENGYIPPVTLWYSKNDKGLNERKELSETSKLDAFYNMFYR